ncbi:MAG: hypothetical protein QOF21_243 [Actinomycetota bacterium]|jgi:uncharacterized protein (TIGR03086 family)
MATEPYERAIASSKKVLAGVTPEHMDAPSPCESWTVRQVLNHLVGGQDFFTVAMTGGSPSVEEGTDFGSGDYQVAFDEGSSAGLASFQAPGALEKIVSLPWGEMPGGAFLGLAATDTFVHGWDLARATGQSTDLDPELAEELLVGSKAAIQDAFRGPDGSGAPFGPEQQAPADATAADRLAAFLGRKV